MLRRCRSFDMEVERGLTGLGLESQCLKLGEEVGELVAAAVSDPGQAPGECVDVLILLASVAKAVFSSPSQDQVALASVDTALLRYRAQVTVHAPADSIKVSAVQADPVDGNTCIVHAGADTPGIERTAGDPQSP